MKVISYILYLLTVTVILAELSLRQLGYSPGIFEKYHDFDIVDSVFLYENYETDAFGIYKFSPWVSDSVRKYYDETEELTLNPRFNNIINWMDGIRDVYKSFSKLELKLEKYEKGEESIDNIDFGNSEFEKSLQSIVRKESAQRQWGKLLKEYVRSPYNREGFRSIAFDSTGAKVPRLLLIGDSFVYGMSASPFYNSYSDILLSRKYIVYNAGIPGVDPAQYAAIAKKYIPLLKPDIVILNFFPGNDLMPFSRAASKEEPHEHMTNAGFFESNPLGKYMTMEEAYAYYLSLIQIPASESLFNKICSKSSILSIFWGLLEDNRIVLNPELENYYSFRGQKTDVEKARICYEYIQEISSICALNGSEIIYTIIPERDKVVEKDKIMGIDTTIMNEVFKNEKYFYPINFTIADFEKEGDIHFTNSGSLKYADFLDSLIQMHYIQKLK